MTVTLDGYTVRQADLNEIFGERDVFLSIFNPLYFIEELADGGKTLLGKLLPPVSHERTLAALGSHDRTLLETEKLPSPQMYLQNRRAEIHELEETLIYSQGQADLLKQQEQERASTISDARARLEAIESQMADYTSIRDGNRDTEKAKERVNELTLRLEEQRNAAPQRQEIQTLLDRIRDKEQTVANRQAAVYESQYITTAAGLEAELKQLYAVHEKTVRLANDVKPGVKCPSCLRAVTAENLDAVKNEILAGLPEIVANGKELKTRLAEVKELEEKAKQVFLQFQADDLAKLNGELDALKESLKTVEMENAMADAAYTDALRDAETRLRQAQTELAYGNLTQQQADEFAKLCEISRELKETMLSAPIEIEGMSESIVNIREAIETKKALARAASNYIAKRAELTFEGVKMNRVSISLFDVVKSTGEVKDTFKFTYDGRSYRWLSLSEKIKAGLEVSGLIKNLTGRDYPVYIDNGESVTAIDNIRPTGQIIYSRVVGGAPLTVTAKVSSASQAA